MKEQVANEPVPKGKGSGRKRMKEILELEDLATYDNNDYSRIVQTEASAGNRDLITPFRILLNNDNRSDNKNNNSDNNKSNSSESSCCLEDVGEETKRNEVLLSNYISPEKKSRNARQERLANLANLLKHRDDSDCSDPFERSPSIEKQRSDEKTPKKMIELQIDIESEGSDNPSPPREEKKPDSSVLNEEKFPASPSRRQNQTIPSQNWLQYKSASEVILMKSSSCKNIVWQGSSKFSILLHDVDEESDISNLEGEMNVRMMYDTAGKSPKKLGAIRKMSDQQDRLQTEPIEVRNPQFKLNFNRLTDGNIFQIAADQKIELSQDDQEDSKPQVLLFDLISCSSGLKVQSNQNIADLDAVSMASLSGVYFNNRNNKLTMNTPSRKSSRYISVLRSSIRHNSDVSQEDSISMCSLPVSPLKDRSPSLLESTDYSQDQIGSKNSSKFSLKSKLPLLNLNMRLVSQVDDTFVVKENLFEEDTQSADDFKNRLLHTNLIINKTKSPFKMMLHQGAQPNESKMFKFFPSKCQSLESSENGDEGKKSSNSEFASFEMAELSQNNKLNLKGLDSCSSASSVTNSQQKFY